MASGTGKTLVALWAAEQEAPKTVLVLVPSLTLLQQTLLQWCKHRNKPFEYIAVCSDPTVVEEDDIDKNDIDFRIATIRHCSAVFATPNKQYESDILHLSIFTSGW